MNLRMMPALVIAKIIMFLIVASISWGFVMQSYWNWFVAPLGVTTISLVHAMGLSALFHAQIVGLAKDTASTMGLSMNQIMVKSFMLIGFIYLAGAGLNLLM